MILHHILDADLEHMQLSVEPYPSPEKYYRLAGFVTESSKGHATILSSQLLQDTEEHSRTSEFHEHGTTVALLLL